jgi:hypothetical protein
MPWSDGLCQGQRYPSHREGGWMVMAVWLTLNLSADATALLERAARARGAPNAPSRLLRSVTATNAPVVSVGRRNHEHHVASVTPVTGREPRDVRERHHLDRGGGPCGRSGSDGRLLPVSAAIVTLCCRSIRATKTSSGRSCFCAVGPSPSRGGREFRGPSEAWRWRLKPPTAARVRIPTVEPRGLSEFAELGGSRQIDLNPHGDPRVHG